MQRTNKPPVFLITAITIIFLLSLSVQSVSAKGKKHPAKGKPFPHIVEALSGSWPEGFAIGKGYTAYNGSIDGSIYKVSLRTGRGRTLVEAEPDFDVLAGDCHKLGMRVDRRTNNLIVAGCGNGDAYVFDADTGEEIMKYQLDDSGNSVINDLAITRNAVYFTDFGQAFMYRLPLSKKGRIPEDTNAATAIPLTGDFEEGDNLIDRFANGIVATPNGKTLIIGHSGTSKIFKVDPNTGHSDEIIVDPPLLGLMEGSFLDGIVLRGHVLYILSPGETAEGDLVQVVKLDKGMRTGTFMGIITDPTMSGIASGALFGKSLYVNNAHYDGCCEVDDEGNLLFDEDGNPVLIYDERWITRLNRHAVEPLD